MNRTVLLVLVLLVVIGGAAAFIFLNPGLLGGGVDPNATLDPNAPTEQVRFSNTDIPLPTNTDIPFTQVVIAVQDIPRGNVITPDVVAVVRFPVESAPQGAFTNLQDAVGLIAATDIYREEILIARKLVQDIGALGSTGSAAAAVLDPARVAIAVPIDRITSVAYALQPGDRVDVIVSMLFVDVDQDFQTLLPNDFRILIPASDEFGNIVLSWSEVAYGTQTTGTFFVPTVNTAAGEEASETTFSGTRGVTFNLVEEPNPLDGRRQRPRLVTQRTVTDAQVVWVGEFPEDGVIFEPAMTSTPVATPTVAAVSTETTTTTNDEGTPIANTAVPPRPSIITLAVRPQDAVVLSWISEAGLPMTFVLRSARTQGLPDTSPVTMGYLLQTYNIQVPDRFSYSLEPAIRDVRGITLLDVGQQRESILADDNSGTPTAEGGE